MTEQLWDRAHAELTPKQLEVVVLRYLAEMTWPQIADALGVSVQAARARHDGAMRRLRQERKAAA